MHQLQLWIAALFVLAVTYPLSSFLATIAFVIYVLDVWITLETQNRLVVLTRSAPIVGLMTLPPVLMDFWCARIAMLLVDQLLMEGCSIIIVYALCTNVSSILTSFLASTVSSSLLYLRLFWKLYVWPGRRGRIGATSAGSESTPSAVLLASRRIRKSPASIGLPSARTLANSTKQKPEPDYEISDTLEKNGDASPLSLPESDPQSLVSSVLSQSGDSWQRRRESLSSSDMSPSAMGRKSVTEELDVAKALLTATISSKKPYSSTTRVTDATKNTEPTESGSPGQAVKIDTDSDSATSNQWSTGWAGSGKNTGQNQTTSKYRYHLRRGPLACKCELCEINRETDLYIAYLAEQIKSERK